MVSLLYGDLVTLNCCAITVSYYSVDEIVGFITKLKAIWLGVIVAISSGIVEKNMAQHLSTCNGRLQDLFSLWDLEGMGRFFSRLKGIYFFTNAFLLSNLCTGIMMNDIWADSCCIPLASLLWYDIIKNCRLNCMKI